MSPLKYRMASIAIAAIALTANVSQAGEIRLGVVIEETPQGIAVTDVIPGGIAERCMPRLRPGAYITTLNGFPVKSAAEFKRVIETSDYVRFDFVDPKGEHRWAHAWSAGNAPPGAVPCCTITANPPAPPIPPLIRPIPPSDSPIPLLPPPVSVPNVMPMSATPFQHMCMRP